MDNSGRLEAFIRYALDCNTGSVSDFRDFNIADKSILKGDGYFYIGFVSALAAVFVEANLDQRTKIGNLVDKLYIYKDTNVEDIEKKKIGELIEEAMDLIRPIVEKRDKNRFKSEFVEEYQYEDCVFTITKEEGLYWARCEEMYKSDDDLESLKKNQIPTCYYQHRKFKL